MNVEFSCSWVTPSTRTWVLISGDNRRQVKRKVKRFVHLANLFGAVSTVTEWLPEHNDYRWYSDKEVSKF
jgi:hypothetical protein